MESSQAATQDFVSVRDIRGKVVIQKNGQMCMILLASSVNFALKSLDEQKGILIQFQLLQIKKIIIPWVQFQQEIVMKF